MKSPLIVWLSVASACFAEPVDFNRDVQPILSENCYHCHGPDAGGRKADLRLDKKEGAYRTADGVTPVKPGDSAGSDVIARIFSADKDEVMPTPKSNRKLTETQKELLKRWVDEGAKWGEHWAFVAPKRAMVPEVSGPGETWARHPIDAFVLERDRKSVV